MTTRQIEQIKAINAQIREYRKMIREILTSGVSSASLGSAGNSTSYTRLSVDEYRKEISRLMREKEIILGRQSRRTSPNFGS